MTCVVCRPQSWNQHADFLLDVANTQLSLVLLGTDGLANQLVNEIRVSRTAAQHGIWFILNN